MPGPFHALGTREGHSPGAFRPPQRSPFRPGAFYYPSSPTPVSASQPVALVDPSLEVTAHTRVAELDAKRPADRRCRRSTRHTRRPTGLAPRTLVRAVFSPPQAEACPPKPGPPGRAVLGPPARALRRSRQPPAPDRPRSPREALRTSAPPTAPREPGPDPSSLVSAAHAAPVAFPTQSPHGSFRLRRLAGRWLAAAVPPRHTAPRDPRSRVAVGHRAATRSALDGGRGSGTRGGADVAPERSGGGTKKRAAEGGSASTPC